MCSGSSSPIGEVTGTNLWEDAAVWIFANRRVVLVVANLCLITSIACFLAWNMVVFPSRAAQSDAPVIGPELRDHVIASEQKIYSVEVELKRQDMVQRQQAKEMVGYSADIAAINANMETMMHTFYAILIVVLGKAIIDLFRGHLTTLEHRERRKRGEA